MTFSEQVRSVRHAKGMTQQELATLLGTDKQTVSNWECGRTEPWPKDQIKILGQLLALQAGRRRVCEALTADVS
jgi:transcriptional regulator with XRE-family HTH domain